MSKIKSFLIALISFVILDAVWLGIIMKDFNMNQLAEIGRIENGAFSMNFPPAIATYILMALAIPIFVLPKLDKNKSLKKAFFTGALMGLILYGVFDLTNLAILKNYPPAFVVPDIAWGAFVFGMVTVISMKIMPRR